MERAFHHEGGCVHRGAEEIAERMHNFIMSSGYPHRHGEKTNRKKKKEQDRLAKKNGRKKKPLQSKWCRDPMIE